MVKCVICNHRPARTAEGYCANCAAQVEKARESTRKHDAKPVKYLTYKGNVVGLFSNGDGTLKSRLMHGNPERLPKDKTLDLNKYCSGFDRSQIKRFKACVLKLAYA